MKRILLVFISITYLVNAHHTPEVPIHWASNITVNGSSIYIGPDTIYSGLELDNIDLSGANLRGSRFVGGSSIRNVNFQHANLKNATFRSVSLISNDFRNAFCQYTDFEYCNFISSNFDDVPFYHYSARMMYHCGFTDMFIGSNFSNIAFDYCELHRVDFSDVNLNSINFTRSSIQDCIFAVNLEETVNNLQSQVDYLNTSNDLEKIRDLRVGSQTFDVSNGTATIRMYVDESSDLTSSWTNTQHVLEVDIPADQDTMFYRFRMD